MPWSGPPGVVSTPLVGATAPPFDQRGLLYPDFVHVVQARETQELDDVQHGVRQPHEPVRQADSPAAVRSRRVDHDGLCAGHDTSVRPGPQVRTRGRSDARTERIAGGLSNFRALRGHNCHRFSGALHAHESIPVVPRLGDGEAEPLVQGDGACPPLPHRQPHRADATVPGVRERGVDKAGGDTPAPECRVRPEPLDLARDPSGELRLARQAPQRGRPGGRRVRPIRRPGRRPDPAHATARAAAVTVSCSRYAPGVGERPAPRRGPQDARGSGRRRDARCRPRPRVRLRPGRQPTPPGDPGLGRDRPTPPQHPPAGPLHALAPHPPAHHFGLGPLPTKNVWRTAASAATFAEAVRENEEVVPVNTVSTWVLPSGVTVGR